MSTLVSTGGLGKQPLRRRMGVWLHLMMCQHCRRFWRQLRSLDRAVRAVIASFEREKPADLDRRIVARLSQPPNPAELQ